MIGQRLYTRGFVSGNDGNISYRLSENEILCTPTKISKGFMTPEDLCVVNMKGDKISGIREITSEIRLHLTIYGACPEVKSVVHCHPPYATAFGIAREPIPPFILPEIEMQLGEIPVARYALPGSEEFAQTVLPYVHHSRIIVLANHGTVSWAPDTVEHAFWRTEMLDAYCQKLLIAKQTGNIEFLTRAEAESLLISKHQQGIPDPRIHPETGEIHLVSVFQKYWKESGVKIRNFPWPDYISHVQ